MYVITFYSFKGGVGRTMALANVGLSLARKGRRVLLVDFDLEAPGLDTFPILRPKVQGKGVVDFVMQYCETGVAPDVSDFYYQAELDGSAAGSMFVMPTGLPGDEYGNRLNSIDWQQLYAERDGYLLFEDLKEQWRRAIQPDYVLIDSRTGHTDVGGICTRQLPDAVALLFFPNEQNERGLKTIVEDIRSEKTRSGRDIDIYFVASNVPDLDDEDRILSQRLKHFQETLKFTDLDVIHHYNSLSLLEQTIFTIDRPKSKLANEYRRLVQRVIGDNFEDRDVALNFINQLIRGRRPTSQPVDVENSLKAIRVLYSNDGEVLYNLALVNRSLGRDEVADLLVKEAQRLGYETEETLVAKAIPAYEAGQVELGRKLIQEALEKPRGRRFTREKVVKAVLSHDPAYLPELVDRLSKSGLEPGVQILIATQMIVTPEGARAAESLLKPLVDNGPQEDLKGLAFNTLVLSLIAQRKFDEAMRLIVDERSTLSQRNLADNFNYAIAEWGATGVVPIDLLSRVIERPAGRRDANFSQCRALAYWANGDKDNARKEVVASLKFLDDTDLTFSCWRYLQVDAHTFGQDLAALTHLIDTDRGLPAVVTSLT